MIPTNKNICTECQFQSENGHSQGCSKYKETCGYMILAGGMTCAEKEPCPWHDVPESERKSEHCDNCEHKTAHVKDLCLKCRLQK